MPVYKAGTAQPVQMPPKDPSSVVDYKFDWAAELAGDSDQITGTPTVSVETGLTKDSQSNSTTAVTVWLSGGEAGKAYDVTCEIVTVGGRTMQRTARVPVAQR